MKQLQAAMQATFDKMLAVGTAPQLFRTEATNTELWNKYLEIMPKDIFRDPNSSMYNCTRCQQFFNKFANIVKIENNLSLTSIFDVELPEGSEYYDAMKELSKLSKSYPIANAFVETESSLSKQAKGFEVVGVKNGKQITPSCVFGIRENHKQFSVEEIAKFGKVDDRIYVFNHFSLLFPKHLLLSNDSSVESYMSQFHSDFIVFKKGLDKISIPAIDTVLEHIESGRIINSEQHVERLVQFKARITEYNSVEPELRANLVWSWGRLSGGRIDGVNNLASSLLGTTLIELTKLQENPYSAEYETELDKYNRYIDPVNYMKAQSAVSTKVINYAVKYLKDNNFEQALNRRSATIDDIDIAEIMYVGKESTEFNIPTKLDTFFEAAENNKKPIKVDKSQVESMDIEYFFSEVMPVSKSVEVYLEPRFNKNMVNLITAENKEAKPIFKWGNNFSWTFNGNLGSTSQIKEKVKGRGGNTEGVLRVSLSFPDTTDDYDLHIEKPFGANINYSRLRETLSCSGRLDLDAQGRDGHQTPQNRVENCVWTDLSAMPIGNYIVKVNNYSKRGLRFGFQVEIEAKGEITLLTLDINKKKFVKEYDTAIVARIRLNSQGEFEIIPGDFMLVTNGLVSSELYGLSTFQFHPVNLVCLSPNYWGNNQSGIKHYMFMLEGAKTKDPLMMFHPEQLVESLHEYRKVMEMFSKKNMVTAEEKQLAGVGFNATLPNDLIVRIDGKKLINLTIKTNSHVSI